MVWSAFRGPSAHERPLGQLQHSGGNDRGLALAVRMESRHRRDISRRGDI